MLRWNIGASDEAKYRLPHFGSFSEPTLCFGVEINNPHSIFMKCLFV